MRDYKRKTQCANKLLKIFQEAARIIENEGSKKCGRTI